jgi:hypothetical protein
MLIIFIGKFQDGNWLQGLAIDVLIVLKLLLKKEDVQGGDWIHLAQNRD